MVKNSPDTLEEDPQDMPSDKKDNPPCSSQSIDDNMSAEPGDGLTDKHGQAAIAAGRYERDMASKDAEIATLRKQVEEAARSAEGRKALEEKLTELEQGQSDMRISYELKLAGCLDDKALRAAKVMLDDYKGDVSALKAECPYLFVAEKR